MNISKQRDPRFWTLWRKSGAVGGVNQKVQEPRKPRRDPDVLSMAEAKAKLANLQEFLPKASNDLVYPFGAFLATRLNDELVPMGFVLGCSLALYDLEKGVDGFTGQPIRSSLVGYPPVIYQFMHMEIPRIAKAIFPEDYANKVQLFLDEVNKSK